MVVVVVEVVELDEESKDQMSTDFASGKMSSGGCSSPRAAAAKFRSFMCKFMTCSPCWATARIPWSWYRSRCCISSARETVLDDVMEGGPRERMSSARLFSMYSRRVSSVDEPQD
uniref:Uncharacterized protein n=1 Tax=Hyaloperonospora arabidopsidis (strain Emoy2) TaxID=559515 RepID=M4C6B9_HYAAE